MKFSRKGFTLIELIVVMSIVGLLISVVGPLTIKELEKAEAKSEFLQLKNKLIALSYRSFILNKEFELEFNGKRIAIKGLDKSPNSNSDGFEVEEFEYLFFQDQTLYYNNKGFVRPSELIGTYRDFDLRLDLAKIVNLELQAEQ